MPLNVTKSVCNAYFSVKVSKDIKKNGPCLACIYRSYGCTREVGRAGEKRLSGTRRSLPEGKPEEHLFHLR